MATTLTWMHQQLDRARPILAAEGPNMVRIVVASVVAWQLCVWLGAQQPPIFAVIVPLVAMRDAPYSALNVSMVRLVGVVGGVGIGIAVLHVIRPSALAVGIVLAIALPFGLLLRVGGAFNVQVAVSALLVFANTNPDAYAATRLWETAVGAAVTVILAALLFPPNPYRTFLATSDEVVTQLADELRTGAQLSGGDDHAGLGRLVDRVRSTEAKGGALPGDLAAARRAISVNPLWRRRYTRPLAALVSIAETTARVASLTRLFAGELVDLADRADLHAQWAGSGPRTRAIIEPLAQAMTVALNGRDARAELRAVHNALHAEHVEDPSGIGAVLRRPLRRMADALDQLSASPTRTPPTGPNIVHIRDAHT
jgi:hypothetical protein